MTNQPNPPTPAKERLSEARKCGNCKHWGCDPDAWDGDLGWCNLPSDFPGDENAFRYQDGACECWESNGDEEESV